MNNSSRIGQRYSIRNNPISPPERTVTTRTRFPSDLEVLLEVDSEFENDLASERQKRHEKRNRTRAESERAASIPPMSAMTVTEVQRPLTSTRQRALRTSAEPKGSLSTAKT